MRYYKEPFITTSIWFPYYGRNNPSVTVSELEEYAIENTKAFIDGGLTKIMIQDENLNGGAAYPETIATMSSIGRLLKREFSNLELGIIVQAHDPYAAMAIAQASGADFVRIKVFSGTMLKSEGIRNGIGIEVKNYRTMLGCNDIKIFADCQDREGFSLVPVPIDVHAGWAERSGADALVLTGKNYEQTLEYLKTVGESDVQLPLLCGGSVNASNVQEILKYADGAVVSSCFQFDDKQQHGLRRWDTEKVKKFMDIVHNF
ncbi:MAG: hypothetical protein IJ091_07765 [Oscillospiraceae bacterium]|nr:hypothetical protein [Oscillospiraceae bacterium]